MPTEAIFYNAMHRSVLDQMLKDQNKGIALYGQPYHKQAIAKLRDEPPNNESPVIIYFSTGDDRATVSYKAEITGWWNKQELDESLHHRIDSEIKTGRYDYGIYGIEEGMVNLIRIRNLIKLRNCFPVSELTKIKDGQPLSGKQISAGWSYVHKRKD